MKTDRLVLILSNLAAVSTVWLSICTMSGDEFESSTFEWQCRSEQTRLGSTVSEVRIASGEQWQITPDDTKTTDPRSAFRRLEDKIALDYDSAVDPKLQLWLEALDARLRNALGILPESTAAGLLDLHTGRLAMIQPDRIEYAASVAKIGILLAWFHAHPAAAEHLDLKTEHELGLMVKASSNEMATRFSRELGLQNIQAALNQLGFYDQSRGGGIWVGRHYGRSDERFGDPIADHSHAVTVRQLLRFYLLLEQGNLISAQASTAMRRIFESSTLPHDPIKFVKALAACRNTLDPADLIDQTGSDVPQAS